MNLRTVRSALEAAIRTASVAVLLAAACGGEESAGATVWDPCGRGDGFETEGRVWRERCHVLSPWFGRADDARSPAAGMISDTRDALLCVLPATIRVSLPADPRPREVRASVRRCGENSMAGISPLDPGPAILEVLLRRGPQLQVLAREELPFPPAVAPEPWRELRAEIPPGPAELEFSARLAEEAAAGERAPAARAADVVVAWASPRVTAAHPAAPPDVLLVSVDALRADALASAPELRSWASRGAVWPRAVAPSNWTLPSYASLFTATDADRHGAGRGPLPREPTGRAPERDYRAVDPSLPTFAEAFRAAGYATAMIHQSPFLEPWTGLDRGFERYARAADGTENALAAAADWWDQERHRPRFLVLHLAAAHLPYEPPEAAGLPPDPLAALEWRAFLAEDHSPGERRAFFALDAAGRSAVAARYRGEVAALDAAVGPWMRQRLRGPRPWIFALHSDHGEELWDDGGFEHGHSFHDAVVRVPLSVVAPGHVAPAVLDHLARARDLGPTLLRLAGLPLPPGWEGDLFAPAAEARSLQPLYRSEHGGRIVAAPPASDVWLPFDPAGSSAAGPPATLDAPLRRALAELGYAGEQPAQER